MSEGNTERRLAAIVAIDVAGYSRLMGADEEGTLAALKGHREVVDPISIEHGGRIVGTAGDGVLLEFPSVIEAVAAAVKVQTIMAERNADIPDDKKMLFRVGINLGDVLVDEDGDIFGEGVNVAARIEALAEPGGIYLSRFARDQIRDRMEIDLEDKGEVEVKNIARPVRVFRVLGKGEEANPPVQAPQQRPRWQISAAIVGLIVLVLAGGGAWWWNKQPDFEPADLAKFAYKLPEKPSIAVLPFDNWSGDKANDYLGDSLTENIIAVLASHPDLFVIARNSSFHYKGKPTKVQQVAEELGVRYVLEGSVQKSGEKIRVTAQLVDAVNGRHLWAERYEREGEDWFSLQDDIAEEIYVALDVNLLSGETARWAWQQNKDFYVQRTHTELLNHWLANTKVGFQKAEQLAQEMIQRRPQNPIGNIWLGWTYFARIQQGFSSDIAGDLTKAAERASKAQKLDNKHPFNLLLMAALNLMTQRHDAAINYADQAMKLAPNVGQFLAIAGWVKLTAGQTREGMALLAQAKRMEPYYLPWIPGLIARGHMMLGQLEKAEVIFRGILASETFRSDAHSGAKRGLAVIAGKTGRLEEARRLVAELRQVEPTISIASIKLENSIYKNKDFLESYLDSLRNAGLPEHPPGKEPKAPPNLPSPSCPSPTSRTTRTRNISPTA